MDSCSKTASRPPVPVDTFSAAETLGDTFQGRTQVMLLAENFIDSEDEKPVEQYQPGSVSIGLACVISNRCS